MNAKKSSNDEYIFSRILIPKGHSEAVYELIWSKLPLGIETEIEDENVEIVRVYFKTAGEAGVLKQAFNRSGFECVALEDGQVKYEDWEDYLHGGFEPLECGELIVVPAENPPEIPDSKKPLSIIPGRGFGTGSHSTTKLCLYAMEKHLPAGVECFDVGAGSGILSIAAIMMGASRVDAVEIDADSVENARENLVLNNCERHVKIVAGSIDKFEGHKYPVILINIISKVIVDLFDRGLIEYLEPDGIIIVSGVLVEEKERFLKIIRQNGLKAVQESQDKEWAGFIFKREL